MRSGIIGFILGVASFFVAAIIFQQAVIRSSAQDFDYHFISCVFSRSQFPWGYLEQGRVLTRFLFPVKVTTTFYDAQYHEVTEADKPGRYGAVVRISLNGGVEQYRFITLYRMPGNFYFEDGHITVAVTQFPPETGIDPVVLRNQGQEIGEVVKNGFFSYHGGSRDLAILLAGLYETSPDDPPAVYRTDVVARDTNWWYGLRQRLGLTEHYHYLVDLPTGYDADPAKKWPLILYLHGGGEKGNDLSLVRSSGLAGAVARGRQLPAIIVSPQVTWTEDWRDPVLLKLLDEVSAKYRVDPDRIYLTGISAGGDEALSLAEIHPDRYAAIVPVTGEGDPRDAARIKDVPIWFFQGLKDDVVPSFQATEMVDALRQAGGHPHLTLFPNAGHSEAWDQAFATDALYTWLLAQKRGQPEVITPGVPTP